MPARNLISGFVHFLRRIRSLKNTKRYFLGWTDTQMGQKGDKGQWWWWAGGVCSLSVRLVVYAYFWAFLNYPFKKESSYICAPKCSPLKGSRPVWTSIMNATYTQAMQQRSLFNQAPGLGKKSHFGISISFFFLRARKKYFRFFLFLTTSQKNISFYFFPEI